MFLNTERLMFRAHSPQDEGAFVAMHMDPEVRRYAGGQAWSEEKARARFCEQYLGKPAETFGLWAAISIETGEYIGMCGLSGGRDDAHLGYYLARRYWHQGLATEAARVFVRHGFDSLRLARIKASAEKGNLASERILLKLGFSRVHDEVLDSGRVISHYELVNKRKAVP